MKRVFIMILCLAAALFSPSHLFAQADRGGISGRITDNSGAVVPQQTVTLRNENTGVVQTAVTNSDGIYVFQNLNPGSYALSIEVAGFKKVERTHTVVDVNQVNKQDITLEVGTATEVVEVSTGVQQLQTTNANTGLVIEQRSIQDLPLVYSNPFMLSLLSPGVTFSTVDPNVRAFDSNTTSVSVNGSQLNSMEYRLDGRPNNRIRLSAYTPSTEFINQYKVETASYDASQGHSAGGFVNTSLKSGTNQLHGSIFASYQNPDLNTSAWHLPGTSVAKASWLREGITAGGPIRKDKLFIFGGYEHVRAASPNPSTFRIPSLAERTGDLSEWLPLGYQVYNPLSGVSKTGGVCGSGKTCVVRTPLANNQIPHSAFDNSIQAKALTYYPTPNLTPSSPGGSNYSYGRAEPDYYYAFVVRSDYTINERQQVYGHYVQSRRNQVGKNAYFTPLWSDVPGPASGTNLTYNNKGVTLGYVYTISPTLLLDAHFGWTRFVNQNVMPSQGILNPTSIGMPAYLVNGLGSAAQAFPRLDVTGYQSLNSDSGVLSHNDITTGSIQVSKLLGRHFLRAGYEYRMYNVNAIAPSMPNGRYQHNGTYASSNSSVSSSAVNGGGYGLAQFLYGLPNSSAVTVNSDMAVRSNYMAQWIHDDWKATPTLTLNFGLRFEYEGPNSERNQKANTYFDFGAPIPNNSFSSLAQQNYATVYNNKPANVPGVSPSSWTANGGLRFLGDSSTSFGGHQVYKAQLWNLLPRVGLAWQAFDKTVVRGGFGIFNDSLSSFYLSGGNSGSTTSFLLPQQGFSQTTSDSASKDSGVTFTAPLSDPFHNVGSVIQQPSGNANGLATGLGGAATFQPSSPRTPYNMRWSAGIQQQFGTAWVMDLSYVGNHGLHLPIQQEFNAVPAQYLSTYTAGADVSVNTALTTTWSNNNPFYTNPTLRAMMTAGLNGSTVAASQLLKPNPQFTSISGYITRGSSIYHAAQATLTRRFAQGASLTSAFTWSKSMDSTVFLNPSDANPWYGISANDRPIRLAMSGIYELPWGRGRQFLSQGGVASAIVGGWQVQGVYQIQSGQPLSFVPASLATSGTSLPVFLGTNPADSSWGRTGYKKSVNAQGIGTWFDTSKWATKTTTATTGGPYPGVYGNQYQIRTLPVRFGGLRADRLNQFDAAIQRNFSLSRLWEPASLQFRFDFINVLNHPVYGGGGSTNAAGPNNTGINTDWTNSAFGQITAQANKPRLYQFNAFIRF